MEDIAKYADIISLPHPEPKTRSRMPAGDRAAQFASFAALPHPGQDTPPEE